MDQLDWTLEAYDYQLPEERIAQNPVNPRDQSRLLVIDSSTSHRHLTFSDLPSLLQPGDLLILNNTRVIPARLYGRKISGAEVEILLLEERQPNCWLALVKPGKRLKIGSQIQFIPTAPGENLAENPAKNPSKGCSSEYSEDSPELNPQDVDSGIQRLTATVTEIDQETGGRVLQFNLPSDRPLVELLDQFGHLPLPPYVTQFQAQSDRYQTIYAVAPGAVAAPTAGLHFTEELFTRLEQNGIEKASITLHVGVGTFRPVEVDDIKTHQMHQEWIEVPASTVEKIQTTQRQGGRIIAVGTTVVRALEGVVASQGQLVPFRGKINLFIYPGYQWQVIEGLITNFHLPRSSLLMLVAALIGREHLLELYTDALAQPQGAFQFPYRFYSFGDAMLILPEARILGQQD